MQKSGTRGTGLPNSYSRFALIAACRADARAKIVITALIVILIRFGSVMVGCAGQMIQIVAGASSGSRSSIRSSSALILPRASWVFGTRFHVKWVPQARRELPLPTGRSTAHPVSVEKLLMILFWASVQQGSIRRATLDLHRSLRLSRKAFRPEVLIIPGSRVRVPPALPTHVNTAALIPLQQESIGGCANRPATPVTTYHDLEALPPDWQISLHARGRQPGLSIRT